jgi:membrane-bound serine protease (ClpP class)
MSVRKWFFALAFSLAAGVVRADVAAPQAPPRPAVLADIDRDINAVTASFVARVISEAAAERSPLVILRLNTPGGRLDSTRDITQSILGSKVPVVGYVGPPGARAASAGFLILMACDVAVMAPGTNAGAASVVGGGGEELPKTISRKMTEDAAALLRSLVAPRGRPQDAAVKSITEAASYSDREAEEKKLIEFVARDLPDLLTKLDGRTIRRVGQPDVVLKTGRTGIVEKRMTAMQRALGVIASPMVAGLLLMIGLVGLYAEMQSPGAVFPGIIGGICLLLALFAMSVLPTSWAGIGLLLLGLLFFFLEVKLTGHGLFAIGGGVSMVLGAVLLFPRDELAPRGDFWFVVGGAITASGILAALSLKALSVQRLPKVTGEGALIGQVVAARTDIHASGKVFVDGAIWEARSASPVARGETVIIVAVEGLRVVVKPEHRSEN